MKFQLSQNHTPEVRIELECKRIDGSILREIKLFAVRGSLAAASGLAQYDDFVITDINSRGRLSATI